MELQVCTTPILQPGVLWDGGAERLFLIVQQNLQKLRHLIWYNRDYMISCVSQNVI